MDHFLQVVVKGATIGIVVTLVSGYDISHWQWWAAIIPLNVAAAI